MRRDSRIDERGRPHQVFFALLKFFPLGVPLPRLGSLLSRNEDCCKPLIVLQPFSSLQFFFRSLEMNTLSPFSQAPPDIVICTVAYLDPCRLVVESSFMPPYSSAPHKSVGTGW